MLTKINKETIRDYCIQKKAVSEGFPFGETVLVFKVADKMFALLSMTGKNSINLKCNPDKAIELREKYPFVLPGYHMNKKHWNTIDLEYDFSPDLLAEWIDDSYKLVASKLSKAKKKLFFSDKE